MKSLGRLLAIALLGSIAVWPEASSQSGDSEKKLTRDEAKKLKNPAPYTKKSITQGRNTFIRLCSTCHGNDGKAELDVVADATNLTAPKGFKSGSSDGEIFRSIRDGAGANITMPPFKPQFSKDEDIWNLVNFIRSIGPEDSRPALQSDDAASSKKQ